MATFEGNTRPSGAQGPTVPPNPTNQQACSYCQRPISKRILAARKPYCGKLCAALGLIAEVHREDNIEWGIGSFERLLGSIEDGDELPLYPVRMRFWEADCPPGDEERAVVVAIDDDRTPDRIADPTQYFGQDEIDEEVEKLLSQSPMGGEEASQ
jgi:endogenous inhibitor of DNA gyrase (YacG/DUF329 family)